MDAGSLISILSHCTVLLRGAEGSYRGECPLHPDPEASLTVRPDLQLWSCDFCRRGGDARAFLLAFTGSAEDPLTRVTTREQAETSKLLRLASDFYHQNATELLPWMGGRSGVFAEPLFSRFRIGLGWEKRSFADHLKRIRAPMNLAVRLGLVGAREVGGPYDLIGNDLVIPLVDDAGHTVGLLRRIANDAYYQDRSIGWEKRWIWKLAVPDGLVDLESFLFGLSVHRQSIIAGTPCAVAQSYNEAVVRMAAQEPCVLGLAQGAPGPLTERQAARLRNLGG